MSDVMANGEWRLSYLSWEVSRSRLGTDVGDSNALVRLASLPMYVLVRVSALRLGGAPEERV